MNLKNYILEYVSSGRRKKETIIVATDKTIKQIVKSELDRLGHDADLNHIDVSGVTDMSYLFCCHKDDLGPAYSDLNPDISGWDVSNAKNMKFMFYNCRNFNQDLSKWDVRNVRSMHAMFYECRNFNQDLSKWDVSKVEDMDFMFYDCINFNQDLSQWKVNKVKGHYFAFDGNCPIKEEYRPKFKKWI